MTIDQAVLLLVAGGTVAAFLRFRQRGVRGRTLVVTTWLAFYGLTLTVMLAAHSVEITYHLVRGEMRISGEPWRYDFHSYALYLLAVAVIWQGLRVIGSAETLAMGDRDARARARGAALMTLAIALPLVPIQPFFGILLSVLSVLTLVILVARG